MGGKQTETTPDGFGARSQRAGPRRPRLTTSAFQYQTSTDRKHALAIGRQGWSARATQAGPHTIFSGGQPRKCSAIHTAWCAPNAAHHAVPMSGPGLPRFVCGGYGCGVCLLAPRVWRPSVCLRNGGAAITRGTLPAAPSSFFFSLGVTRTVLCDALHW